MIVDVKRNRELKLTNAQNTQNENRAETISLVVPEEYEDYNKKIVFITPDGNVWDVITNNEYKITNAITKYKDVDFYIWLTKEVDGETIDFRTKTKPLKFYDNQDASGEITPEEISGVTTVINLLEEEITKVENLDLDITKVGSTATVTITKKDGTTKEVEINDGQDGYTPQKGTDYFTQEDIEEIENGVKNDLQETVLVNYSLIAETGSKIELSINTTNYKLTAILKDKNNATICTSNEIDLPLETMVVNATYDNTTKKIILTLQNGTTVEFSVADLVSGLVSESQLQTILANYYTQTEINNLLANKVDKVAGKGLSTEDYTTEEKAKLYGIEQEANKTIVDDELDNESENPVQNKVINTEIEKLQTENARFKATLPTTGEVTGQDITLDKTAELEFKKPPLPIGNSEQDGEPSPDNEVPITNVTGDVEVVVQNRNLALNDNPQNPDANYSSSGGGTSAIQYSTQDSGYYTTNHRRRSFGILKAGSYTLSIKAKKRDGTSGYGILTSIKGYTESVVPKTSLTTNFIIFNYNFTIQQDKELVLLFYDTVYWKDIQLEKGSATDYVAHKSQTFTFPLGNEKLMLGDYLADDGIHHVREQVVLDGTEDIGNYRPDISSVYYCFYVPINNLDSSKNSLCNKFVRAYGSTYNQTANSYYSFSNNYVYISIARSVIGATSEDTANDCKAKAKAWLAQQYTNNTPVIFENSLLTEQIVPYTSAQQTVYDAIKEAMSYEEQTNISGSSTGSNPIFSVEAYLDSKVILAEKVDKVTGKGLSTNDFTNTYKNNVDSNTNARHTHSNKTVLDGIASSDITNWNGKQNATDNSLTTINKTIVGAINEVDSIAKGANQALSYSNYSAMITAFNSLANDVYNVGQNVMIVTLEVPDLWISGIESTSSSYTYTTDEAFTTALSTNGYVQVGYYILSALETQKVDLINYYNKPQTDSLLNKKADIIEITKNGSVVQFEDGANNLNINSLIANIEPVQDLHGYSKPWAGGQNVNLLNPDKVSTMTGFGLTVTFDKNTSTFTISGTPTSHYSNMAFNFVNYADYSLSGKNYKIQAFDVVGTPIRNIYGLRYDDENKIAIMFDSATYETIDVSFKVSVAITTQSSWTPYENICPISGWNGMILNHSDENTNNPDIYNISWQNEVGIIYKGNLDIITGVLTVTDQVISSYNGETLPSTWISDRDDYVEGTTPTIGAQVVYKLLTPVEYQLTPHEIRTFLGTNNIWANTGDVTVNYKADTKLYIDSKLQLLEDRLALLENI